MSRKYMLGKEPLKQQWWQEDVDARERYGATFHLIVTERPIAFLDVKLSESAQGVLKYVGVQWKYPLIIVIADLSEAKDADQKTTVLKAARATLTEIGKSLGQYQNATVGS